MDKFTHKWHTKQMNRGYFASSKPVPLWFKATTITVFLGIIVGIGLLIKYMVP